MRRGRLRPGASRGSRTAGQVRLHLLFESGRLDVSNARSLNPQPLVAAQMFSNSRSSQTSTWSPSARNRQPGGNDRNRTASGQYSSKWITCKGENASSSPGNVSPPQMYQPHAPDSRGWRRPLSGFLSSVPSAIPSFSSSVATSGTAPTCWQISDCELRVDTQRGKDA